MNSCSQLEGPEAHRAGRTPSGPVVRELSEPIEVLRGSQAESLCRFQIDELFFVCDVSRRNFLCTQRPAKAKPPVLASRSTSG